MMLLLVGAGVLPPGHTTSGARLPIFVAVTVRVLGWGPAASPEGGKLVKASGAEDLAMAGCMRDPAMADGTGCPAMAGGMGCGSEAARDMMPADSHTADGGGGRGGGTDH